MSQPMPLQSSFKRGMVRDFPRDAMPGNTAWDIKDFVPDLEGEPLAKRGGWSYASPSVSSISGGGTGMYGVVSAPIGTSFIGTSDKLVGFTDSGYSIDISSSTSAASISSSDSILLYGVPTIFNNQLIYMTSSGLRRYTGTGSTSSVSLAPTGGVGATTYRSSVVLGGDGTNLNRLHFSKPGDYSVWDTTNGYVDVQGVILGVAAFAGIMLVFTPHSVLRVRGAPPPFTGSTAQVSPDLTVDMIFNQGGLLTRSHLVVGERCYFANQQGLFVTDGAGVTNLTEDSGFSRYWQDSFSTIEPRVNFDQIILGAYGKYIFCSPLYDFIGSGATDNGIGTFVFNTVTKAWFRMTNMTVSMYSTSRSTGETYFALRNIPRVGKMSTVFAPTSSVKADADGTAIQPTLETMYYKFRPHGTKRFKSLYVNYDLRDAASDNPVLGISYATRPEATSYTATESVSETSQSARKRVPLRFAAEGVSLKVVQTGNSSVTRLYDLEADAHAREQSRL